MKSKVQSPKSKVIWKFKVQSSRFKVRKSLRAIGLFLLIAYCSLFTAFGQNDLQTIADGGHIEKWLVSDALPAEIDAGMWENFNRFNIENLPQKDWLAPFGGAANVKPQPGTQKAAVQNQLSENQKPKTHNPKSVDAALPEIGADSKTKVLADINEINWREIALTNSNIDFYELSGGKLIGTAYAAAFVNSSTNENRFLETGGFLGSIWLNGEKIYDGYALNAPVTTRAKFKKGTNTLLVRASGVANDYWRKNGGWTALIRIWKSETDAEKSAEHKSTNTAGTIFYLEGFHVDPVYLQDQRGYSKITLSNTNQYLNSLRADPLYGVYLSEIDYLKPYLDTHPEDRDFLREAVQKGRVGAGGAYNQFNELNIGGESIVRNILYGQAMHEAMLGRRAKSLALWDVFGHAPQITQIARKSGFNGIAWSKKITGFEPFFYDYALDGSKLPHRRVDYAYSFSGFGSGKNYTIDNFRRMTERKFAETQSYNSAVDLRINAADFTPPWTNLAGNAEKLEQNRPQIRVTGQAQDLYFDALNKEIAENKIKMPVTSRDKLFFHVGVMAARSDLKVAHRLTENMTLTAERFGAIAYLHGAKYPDLALDKAWRQIFFGSHHDAITGTPSDSALLDLVHGYREAFELSKDALTDSLTFLAGQINTKANLKYQNTNPKPIIVFNPLNWTRNDVVRLRVDFGKLSFGYELVDEKGSVVNLEFDEYRERESIREIEFVAENVPSIGYKTYYFRPNKFARLKFGGLTPPPNRRIIENEFYRVTINLDKGGAISSIYDKQAQIEIINTANGHYANEIASLREELTKKNVIYPAWEFWTTGERKFSTEKKAQVVLKSRVINDKTLVIEGELPNMQKYRQTISLHKGIKRIDFKTELVDYKGKDELFIVNFPLNLTGGALVTEDRFGTVVRNNSKGFLDFRTNTDKLVSGAPVYGVNNWAEYGSTFNLKFVDANGRPVSSVPFKPTALVRPHGGNYEKSTETIVAALIRKGVSVTPFYDDNDAARRTKLTIEDSTMPKTLNDDIAYNGFRIALGDGSENLYTAKILKQVSTETQAKFDAILRRDGFAYLFAYDKDVPKDWAPMPTLIIAGDIEKAIERINNLNAFEISLPFESFAAETNPAKELPRVPDYGVALINNGTPAVSLENPNTLTLFLTHTAMFPGVNLPFEFVPENKTHVFTYALYPHNGDWREADTVKVGADFNNPLIAVQTDIHDGDLPSTNSFLTTGNDVLLSSLKLGENPQADFRSISNERPVIARFYEAENKTVNSAAILRFHSTKDVFQTDLLERNDKPFINKTSGLEELLIGEDGNRFNKGCCSLFPIKLNPFEIQTYKIFAEKELSKSESVSPAIGATKELVQPVFSRYWLHNSGAAPIGNDAVKVSLRRVEQMNELSTFSYDDKYNQGGTTTVPVRVQVVNNYQDRNFKGEVVLDVPEDWRIVPDKLNFDIAPNGSFVKDVVILGFPVKKDLEFERASGLVKARIEHEGQIFQDVLNLGNPFNLEWETEKTANGIAVKIKNPHRQTIEGAVALIMPIETWAGGAYSDEPISPREQGFSVKPNEEITIRFETAKLPEGVWQIARIAYNGFIDYKRADGK
ncbi:MAG TPA: glycoside hydrolase family 38 C-terminal domain-containing protein [Pyrinomonadaceae bacterium]|jgi:alpha-mannosidase